MSDERTEVTRPTVTGNAQLALGYVMALLMTRGLYRPLETDVVSGVLEFEHRDTKSRFQLTIYQAGGVE